MIKDNLIEVLHEMEEVTKLFNLERDDLFESKKSEFEKKLKIFREKYNV